MVPGLRAFWLTLSSAKRALEELVTFLQGNSAQGLVIDFEEVPKDAHKDVLTFLHELKAAFIPHWMAARHRCSL